jgi:FkbM family methyltransferase
MKIFSKFSNRVEEKSFEPGVNYDSSGIDKVSGPEGEQFFFRRDDTIGESLRRYGEWARNEMDYFANFISLGDFVVDIGCNVGTHTMFFSEKVGINGHVFSIDAQMAAIALTSLTASVQRRDNISVFNVAVGEKYELVKFPNPDYNLQNNFGALRKSDGGKVVPQIQLDGLKLNKVDFIKMDIEGDELNALKGAQETISQHRPKISCEILEESAKTGIMNFLDDFGYIYEDHTIPAFNPKNFLSGEFNIFGPATERVMVCIPKM